jgi:hypothetical protein
MSHAMRIVIISVATLAALFSSQSVSADEDKVPLATTPPVAEQASVVATPARANPLGTRPVELKILARKRGGADVVNDSQLRGVVADNRAVNVTTGNNIVSDGAFSGMSGMPLLVQNSGNNVLIQNATIVNVQVK